MDASAGDLLTALARAHGLAGLDGLDAPATPLPPPPSTEQLPLTLTPAAAERIRREIARAGGREVCFLASVTGERVVEDPRAVARGNQGAVLAAARDAEAGGLLIHNHPSGVLEPSEADLAVAARVWEEGLGTAITDNDAGQLYVVVEPPTPSPTQLLDPSALEALLAPGGRLSTLHAGFEDRPGQREMLRTVTARFNEGGVAIVEAGTGTGKSVAYLVPAAAWALQNRERTVISTNTINLQEQLVSKDLPLVRQLLQGWGEEVEWALVKGRGNYVSIRRARLAAESAQSLFPDGRADELRAVHEWTQKTDDGSLSDLAFVPSDEVWEEVRSDPDMCLRARCPHFTDCFYQRSRRAASRARLLVVNHHLLFTDLSVRRATDNYAQPAVLPPYRRLVLDEAHNVEDAATSHLGAEVTRAGLYRILSRLERRGKGILVAVEGALRKRGAGSRELRRVEAGVRPALQEARAAVEDLVEALEPLARAAESRVVRLGAQGLPEPTADAETAELLERALGACERLEREVGALRRALLALEEPEQSLQARTMDLQSIERRLAAAGHGLRLVLDPAAGGDEFVRWLELRGRPPRENLVLAAAPVEPGRLIQDALFSRSHTVVLTSATLTTRRKFDFLRERLGLTADLERSSQLQVVEAVVPSPFDFRSQTLLVVPTDLPDAAGAGSQELHAETARVTRELAAMTGGGIFVLFTSHGSLRRVAELLRGFPDLSRFPLLVQGEDGRGKLLDAFVRSGNAVLLGTSSFWEGVDVPGWPLRALVIQKLPFRVPTEPVTAARVEALERAGRDAFWEFMLPLAALRLKQGFGRLIRSRQDRGVVVLLDDRILRRRYGRYLRDSLPEAPLLKGAWEEVVRPVRSFYGGA